ncbi:MAG: 50S ribosomal protein L11 methyltransferase [Syntrophales bacterium]|nr:50S ribosomal protein L11 methyltransferase [Syntrophales bacterium]MDD5232066.1 50S ribosomal protein L11 methyltransferase [Syntrophales bacterium]MDD5532933.1 50S ribosomal protein L11 methyltransferase [Syntrophales bacterium]
MPNGTEKSGKEAWIEIAITSPPELIEGLANFITELGATGTFQEEDADQPGGAELSVFAPPLREELKAYLPADSPWKEKLDRLKTYIENLVDLFPDLKQPDFTVKTLSDPDWGEQWKKYFKPLRIHKNIVIKPTWERYTATGRDIVIEIDPGMAFGTGQHSSTRMCLEALEEILLKDRTIRNWRVLDVGTGTGILSICCAKMGAAKITAVDIDPQAVEIARKNIAINQVGDRVEVVKSDISKYKAGGFDLIVANLNAEPLIKLRSHLISLMEKKGYLIISGIIEKSVDAIEKKFLKPPLSVQNVLRDKEWVCYVLRQKGS